MTQAMEDLQHYIQKELEKHFSPEELFIQDTTHQHIKHKGNTPGASHFKVAMKAKVFQGLSPIKRQRMVLKLFENMIPFPIHSLSLNLKACS